MNKFIAILCCVSLFAVTASARPGHGPHRGPRHHSDRSYHSGHNDAARDCVGLGAGFALGACLAGSRCSIETPAPTPKKIINPTSLPEPKPLLAANKGRVSTTAMVNARRNPSPVAKNHTGSVASKRR